MGDEPAPDLALVGRDDLHDVGVVAVLDESPADRVDTDGRAARRDVRRLDDDGGPCGERPEDRAERDRDGEVPRRGDDGETLRGEGRPGDLVEVSGPLGVVRREVDGLAHLGVGLADGLAGLVDHRGDEVRAGLL